jgi:hypothetical protein
MQKHPQSCGIPKKIVKRPATLPPSPTYTLAPPQDPELVYYPVASFTTETNCKLVVYKKYGILICQQCRQSIAPADAYLHLTAVHNLMPNKKKSEEINDSLFKCPVPLAFGPEDPIVKNMKTAKFHRTIPLLDTIDGFQCPFCSLCSLKDAFGSHWKQHQNLEDTFLMIPKPVKLQVLYALYEKSVFFRVKGMFVKL